MPIFGPMAVILLTNTPSPELLTMYETTAAHSLMMAGD